MTLDAPTDDDRWSGARVRLIAGVLALAFAVIVGRAGHVALAGQSNQAASQVASHAVRRANIVDRNGDLLATSLTAWTLSADPSAIWDAREVAAGVASVIPDINADATAKRLSDPSRKYVAIRRGLTPRQRQAVMELGLEGLYFHEELRRIYPAGTLAGHLLGFTDVDGNGIEGLEYVFDKQLGQGGEPLRLTLDAGVQFALESELETASEEFVMKGAAGIVLEVGTGKVRAIASWPFIDPNFPGKLDDAAVRNRALNSLYDLGSVFKPLTVAAALETGAIKKFDLFDVSQPIVIQNKAITDGHQFEYPEAVSVEDILVQSSNIGIVQIAQQLGVGAEKAFLDKSGLFTKPNYLGPATQSPLLPEHWDPLTAATVSYGHGIAVTPLAFIVSFAALANGGEYISPVFVDLDTPVEPERHQVMSSETAASVLAMLRNVVLRGTGAMADAPGYEVAGKTGTAEKPVEGTYRVDKNIASFAAIFPASRPEYVVLIVLDEAEPKSGGSRTAAVTAAAIAGRLISRSAAMLDVEPVFKSPAVVEDLRPIALAESPPT